MMKNGYSVIELLMDSMNQEVGVENYTNGVRFWFTLDAATKQQ